MTQKTYPTILALDLGTHTGWAACDNTGFTTSGTIHFKTTRFVELLRCRTGEMPDNCPPPKKTYITISKRTVFYNLNYKSLKFQTRNK